MTDEPTGEVTNPAANQAPQQAPNAGVPAKPEPSYKPHVVTDNDLIMTVERGLQIVQEGDPVQSLHEKADKPK